VRSRRSRVVFLAAVAMAAMAALRPALVKEPATVAPAGSATGIISTSIRGSRVAYEFTLARRGKSPIQVRLSGYRPALLARGRTVTVWGKLRGSTLYGFPNSIAVARMP
jgi:hypothetical protein